MKFINLEGIEKVKIEGKKKSLIHLRSDSTQQIKEAIQQQKNK